MNNFRGKGQKKAVFKSCQNLRRFDVSGFPTLKFFPKGYKAGEEYDGGRDLEDFVKFLNEKSGTSRDAKGELTSKVSNSDHRGCIS